MKTTVFLFGVMLLLPLVAHQATAQNGDDLFQQALQKERSQGDLEGAIGLYQEIVDKFADARRPLAADGEAHR